MPEIGKKLFFGIIDKADIHVHITCDTVHRPLVAVLPHREPVRIIGDVSRLMKERGIGPEDLVLSPGHLAKLITLTGAGRINLNTAREVLEAVFDGDRDPEAYVKEHGLLMVNDDEALEKAVEAALKANPKTVEEYRAGKTKVMGFLVGQVMKGMKGKANPAKVNEILAERLKG